MHAFLQVRQKMQLEAVTLPLPTVAYRCAQEKHLEGSSDGKDAFDVCITTYEVRKPLHTVTYRYIPFHTVTSVHTVTTCEVSGSMQPPSCARRV